MSIPDFNNVEMYASDFIPENLVVENEGGNKILKNYMPAGGFLLGESGFDFPVYLNDQTQDELYLTYKIKASENFGTEYRSNDEPGGEFHLEGKLSGFDTYNKEWIVGNPPPPDGGFSVVTMFTSETEGHPGKYRLYFYVHYQEMSCSSPPPNCWGNVFDIDYYFTPDTWYELTLRLSLNDPGQSNGVVEFFVNRNLVATHEGFKFRDSDNVHINEFSFLNFLGGGGNAPEENGWWKFDDIVIYNFKQGVNVPRTGETWERRGTLTPPNA